MATRDRSVPRIDSVEDFARLSARLAEPFADRTSTLAEWRLDESQWGEIRRFFHGELERAAASAAPAQAPACVRYRDAFTAARSGAEPVPASDPPSSLAPPSIPSPPPPQEEPLVPVRAVPSHMLGLGAVTPHHAPPVAFQAPPVALHAQAPVVSVAAPPRIIQMGTPIGHTAFASNPASDLKSTLPFAAGSAAPPTSRRPASSAPAPGPRSQVGSGTRMADEAPAKPALPFQGDPAAQGEWTIERYAAVCIALIAPGRARADVLAEHGCTEPLLVSLNTYWKGMMAREPEVHRRWKDAWRRARG
jgi:hypothetical protein